MCVFEIVSITNLILLGGTVYIRSLNNLEQPTSRYFLYCFKKQKSVFASTEFQRKVQLCYLGNESAFCCLLLQQQGWIKT